jgi:hypothetical protein
MQKHQAAKSLTHTLAKNYFGTRLNQEMVSGTWDTSPEIGTTIITHNIQMVG